MVESIKDAVLINGFFFSLPLIGYAVILLLKNKITNTQISAVAKIILSQHIFTRFVAAFTVAYFIFAVVSIPLYLFHLPAIVGTISYLVLLVAALVYLSSFLVKKLFINEKYDPFILKNETLLVKLLVVLILIILSADFILTIFVAKAFPWGDGLYHMARVMSIVSDGFNVQTTYFNNVPESGYMYNATYTLFSIPSVLFHLDAMKVWEFSLGFFRLLMWTSIFTLAAVVFRYWLKVKENWYLFSTLSLVSAIAINAAGFFVANYQSRIAVIWFILLIILLSISSKKYRKVTDVFIVCVSFLLAMTHIIYAVVAACFLGLYVAISAVIFRKAFFTKDKAITFASSFLVLLSTPLISKLLPVRASEELINLKEAPTISVFGMKILAPVLPSSALNGIVFVVWIFGLIVAAYILSQKKSYGRLVLLLVITLFYPFIVYVPFVFTTLNHLLPIWVIERFAAMDVISLICFGLGMYALYHIGNLIGARFTKNTMNTMTAVVVAITLVLSGVLAKQTYTELLKDRKEKQIQYQMQDQTVDAFRNILKDNKLVITTPTYSYVFAALFNVDILAVEYGHSPIASDGENRSLCQEYILKNLGLNELKAVGADYIIQFPSDKESTANNKPYLKFVSGTEYFNLFEVQKNYNSTNNKIYKPCLDFQRIEKS